METGQEEITKASDERNRLVEKHLGLVYKIALKYRKSITNSSINKHDLIQEGSLGLMRAVEKFDKSLGYKFSTYASYWIRAGVINCLIDNGSLIEIPRYISQFICELKRDSGLLPAQLLHESNQEELAKAMGWSDSRIENVLHGMRSRRIVSIDGPVDSSDNTQKGLLKRKTWADFLSVDNSQLEKEKGLRQIAIRALATSKISERNLYIFWTTIFAEKKLKEVGGDLAITRERVRQLGGKVIKCLLRPPIPMLKKSFLAGEMDLGIVIAQILKPDPGKEKFLTDLDAYIRRNENGGDAAHEEFFDILEKKKAAWRQEAVLYKAKKAGINI